MTSAYTGGFLRDTSTGALVVSDPTATSSGYLGAWAASTVYKAKQIVTAPDGTLQAAVADFTSGTSFDPANWTPIGTGPVARRVRSTVFGGLPVVASGGIRFGGVAGSGQTIGNSRKQFIMTTAANEVRVVYPGYGYDTVDAAQQIAITAGIEYPLGGTVYPVFFGGKLSGVVDPAGVLISDPVAIDALDDDAIYVRTFVTVASTTGGWPSTYLTKLARNEGGSTGGSDLSKVTTGITSADGVGVYIPAAVIGVPTATTYPPVVAMIGDSIMKGDLDPDDIGFAIRAFNDQIAWIDLSKGSETAATFATKSGTIKRRRLLTACTHAICNHGVNDLSGTLANIQANNLIIWNYCANRGIRAWHLTITPRTTTTDSYATTANQTIGANETKRTQFNDWLRDSAPIDATTKAAVATGTSSNVLRAGMVGHPLAGYMDTGRFMEVNSSNVVTTNGGFWKVDGTANKYTSDGLHPSTAGHILMVPGIDTTKFTAVA